MLSSYSVTLSVKTGQQWKRVRSVVSPVFSASNVRALAPIVDVKVQTLVSKLREVSGNGKGFDIYDQFQMLTMDVIAQLGKSPINLLISIELNPSSLLHRHFD